MAALPGAAWLAGVYILGMVRDSLVRRDTRARSLLVSLSRDKGLLKRQVRALDSVNRELEERLSRQRDSITSLHSQMQMLSSLNLSKALLALLEIVRRFVGASPGLSWDDPRFRSLRADLQSHLAAVAADAREEFGRPWGLIAMDRVSGRTAQATVQVSGGRVALLKARPTTAGAASGGSIEAP